MFLNQHIRMSLNLEYKFHKNEIYILFASVDNA